MYLLMQTKKNDTDFNIDVIFITDYPFTSAMRAIKSKTLFE